MPNSIIGHLPARVHMDSPGVPAEWNWALMKEVWTLWAVARLRSAAIRARK